MTKSIYRKSKELFNLDILDRVLKRFFNVDSLEKAQNIIEEALKAQERVKQLQ